MLKHDEMEKEQALVSKTKHIQTERNNKNNNKREILKNSNAKNFKAKDRLNPTVPYQDNLKTTTEKNYNEPL